MQNIYFNTLRFRTMPKSYSTIAQLKAVSRNGLRNNSYSKIKKKQKGDQSWLQKKLQALSKECKF